MGIFKDFKGMVDVARSDELKDMRRMAEAQPRTSMMDALKTGTAALSQANDMKGALTDGVAGTARINSVAPTGQMINQTPVLAFNLTVTVPGQPAYDVDHTQRVSPMAIAGFQPGVTMAARVAADDPSSIFLGA
ncbi:MAG: hypothetical protein ACR2K9_04980 [Solirubrobacteraceae bacterium]